MAVPRLSGIGSSFSEVRLYDQTLAALRYAQQTAIATQRTVCATFTGGTQLALTYSTAYDPPACGPALAPPGGVGSSQYIVTGQGASYSGEVNFNFDRLGRPSVTPIVITVSGGRQIRVEQETGYVH